VLELQNVVFVLFEAQCPLTLVIVLLKQRLDLQNIATDLGVSSEL